VEELKTKLAFVTDELMQRIVGGTVPGTVLKPTDTEFEIIGADGTLLPFNAVARELSGCPAIPSESSSAPIHFSISISVDFCISYSCNNINNYKRLMVNE